MEKFIENVPGVTADSITKVKHIAAPVAAEAIVAARNANTGAFNKTQLGALVANLPSEIKDDTARLRDWLERWYDGTMASVTASYRKNIRWWAAAAGLVVTSGVGLDSIAVVQQLYRSPSERALVVAEASRVTTPTTGATGASAGGAATCTEETFEGRLECARDAADKVTTLHFSYWNTPEEGRNDEWLIALGLLATWAATAAGAPFWFDILKRMSGLRSPPPQTNTTTA
jgi:hypothetical protein